MGYNIKAIRESKGMSQEELSAKSGVSRPIISMLETGTRETTTTKTLLALAKALDVSVEEIFFAEDVKSA